MEKERAREEVRRKYRGKVEKILQNKQSKEQERQRLLKEKREELEDRLENKRTLKKKQQRERMLKNKERKRKYQEKLRKVDLNREKIRRQMSEKKERKNVELFKTISKAQEIIVENRFMNELKLRETLDKNTRIEHIKNPTGKYLVKKDEILNKFKMKEGVLRQIKELFWGNNNERSLAIE